MTRRAIVIGAVLCCIGLPPLFVLVNAASSYSVNRTNGTILTSAGQTREYILYVPKSYDRTKPAPLVISLHGAGLWGAKHEVAGHGLRGIRNRRVGRSLLRSRSALSRLAMRAG